MRAAAPIIAALAFALASCGGDSKEEKAQQAVCDARADLSKQVDQLKGMTPSTFSTDAASQSLSAIGSDLTKIKNAQADLSDDRRQQVQSANQEFASQIRGIAQQVAATKSAAEAKSAITAALQQLGNAYEQTFAKVDCS